MVFALIIGISIVIVIKQAKLKEAWNIIKEGFNWKLPLAIFGVMLFRFVVEYSSTVSPLLPFINSSGVPATIILISISWIIGLVTSMPMAGIALIVPLAAVMLENMTASIVSIIYLAVTYAYIISPMHLCLILVAGYYRSGLTRVYRKLILPS